MKRLADESLAGSRRRLAPQGADGDPAPFEVSNEAGTSPLVIICDHAGRLVPRGLDLGVSAADMERHIAWDIGAGALSRRLGGMLDACVIAQPYSRLVADCNRGPDRPDAVAETSDATAIPGNRGLEPGARGRRIAEIHAPYHARIAAVLDAREALGRTTALLLMHSFTPVMAGTGRPWSYGVLHTGQPLALEVLGRLRGAGVGEVGDNQPYAMDETDYTAARHGGGRGLDFVEIEVRQDLIADDAGRAVVADLFAGMFGDILRAGLIGRPGPAGRE